jgi:septal ring factor EnvC (AmiA/AmiB activator)
MITREPRVEPSPYEEYIIDSLLESSDGQQALLDTIQQLSEERNTLRSWLAEHPQSHHAAAQRISLIDEKLKALWAEVRRVRAARRVLLEEALGIDPARVVH